MFGESESESPRVPSPWDSLISTPPSPTPFQHSQTLNPLTIELLPRLVPESDDGNVEYKLQLLNPSPARFARLVTQLKWRLLEGGGQAYYELGVADSGALVGLPREEIEQSLETLEMMAGEIGASVIVVKEVEIPAHVADLAVTQTDKWSRKPRKGQAGTDPNDHDESFMAAAATEDETEPTDIDADENLSLSLVLDHDEMSSPEASEVLSIFSMDPDLDTPESRDVYQDTRRLAHTPIVIDLEIATVFKPRPMRVRMHHNHAHVGAAKGKRMKKFKPSVFSNAAAKHEQSDSNHNSFIKPSKAERRKQLRDRKRDERRMALVSYIAESISDAARSFDNKSNATQSTHNTGLASNTDDLVLGLESLHVSVDEPLQVSNVSDDHPYITAGPKETDDEDDVIPSPRFPLPSVSKASDALIPASQGGEGVDPAEQLLHARNRLIVEALVVRKMSLEEGFLDFGGFSLL